MSPNSCSPLAHSCVHAPKLTPACVVYVAPSSQGGLDVTPDMETDVLTYKEGLYLATMGGASALGIEVTVGNKHLLPNLRACVSNVGSAPSSSGP
jgi:hypothetical protein